MRRACLRLPSSCRSGDQVWQQFGLGLHQLLGYEPAKHLRAARVEVRAVELRLGVGRVLSRCIRVENRIELVHLLLRHGIQHRRGERIQIDDGN